MQSFAFSFRLSKVGSLIEWLLRSSFSICGENPMFRILNSLSSFSDVDVLLLPGSTSFVFQMVRASLHDCCFS